MERCQWLPLFWCYAKLDLLLCGGKRAGHHAPDVELALHRVLFDDAVVSHRRLLTLDVEGEREMDGRPLHCSSQVRIAQLSGIFPGQFFTVLLEGDDRR